MYLFIQIYYIFLYEQFLVKISKNDYLEQPEN